MAQMAVDMDALEPFLGYFQFEDADKNMEPLMKAYGYDVVKRMIAMKLKPTASLLWIESNDGVKMLQTTMKMAFHGVENHFTLGEPFIENLVDFRSVESVWTLEGNCLKSVSMDRKNGLESVVERWIKGDNHKAIIKCNNIVCVNNWKKLSGPLTELQRLNEPSMSQ